MTTTTAGLRYRRAFVAALLAVLAVFIAVADTVLLSSQRGLLLEEAHQRARRELDLVASLSREALLRRDYVTAERYLREWAGGRPEVVALRAVAPNGFAVVDFQRPGGAGEPATLASELSYQGEPLLTLTLTRDFSHLNDRLRDRGYRFVAVSVLLGGLLGLMLWWLLGRSTLVPLERAFVEEGLRSQRLGQRLQALLAHTPALVYIKDAAGRYLEANAAYARLFDKGVGEMVGRTDQEVMVGENPFAQGDDGIFEAGCGAEREVEMKGPDQRRVFFCNKFPVECGALGEVLAVGSIAMDISVSKAQSEALEYQAMHDALTDLPNRTLLYDRLQQALRAAYRSVRPVALLMMDLDRFKEVNDTLGHHVGDELLQQVAQRLTVALRDSDTVARLGGDEFAALLPNVDEDHVRTVGAKLRSAMEPPFRLEGRTLSVHMSIGAALFPRHGADSDTLLKRADVAMYQAKRSQLGLALYDPGADEHSVERLALVGDLRKAIEKGELVLHYQPKVDIKSRGVRSVEALVRWKHPEHGLIGPDRFIPVAEQTGLIGPLTQWVLGTALGQLARWRQDGVELSMAINISAINLQDPDLADQIADRLKAYDLPADAVELEVTESALMTDPLRSLDNLQRLNAMGLRLSIDDFGTGYASLAYLKHLPVHQIKIDKSFVKGMAADSHDAMIVRATIDLAHNLGLKVVAEGVETAEVWGLLANLGCDDAQGYYMNRPVAPLDLVEWLKGWGAPEDLAEAVGKATAQAARAG